MFSVTAQVSHQVGQFRCQFRVSNRACVTVVDNNKAVVCCLLATSAKMLSETQKKCKMWSKKWYLNRNILCSAQLFYSFWKVECLEMMPSWCGQVN
jgi:hypothetical protein